MCEAMSLRESERVICSNGKLAAAVGVALRDLSPKHHGEANRWSAYLYASGWKSSTTYRTGGPLTHRQFVKISANDALGRLQGVGLVSTSFLAWMFIQFVVVPYLKRLIQAWFFGSSGDA
jgi:hypothetical protein